MSFESRLQKYKKVDDKTGCWNWSGSTNPNGYGQLNDKGKIRRVHRVSAHLFLGMPLDSDDLVLHKCDNKKCYNPEHLYVGSKADNSRDYHVSLKAQGRTFDWFRPQ